MQWVNLRKPHAYGKSMVKMMQAAKITRRNATVTRLYTKSGAGGGIRSSLQDAPSAFFGGFRYQGDG